ncbi:MAG: glycoside hydrolase family 57 [Candidatus Omnitrophica bacterium]|nr:glycoside hydrolase family 57 [Candidatus Omnitrophota bacterium]
MKTTYYALGLHMHQPPGNLRLLIDTNEWEAQQIIKCYERAPRYADTYKDIVSFHVGFSGILLEQFTDPEIVSRYKKFVDIPEMIERYRQADNIEIIGMGYYHPIFPLIPREDWAEQLKRGKDIVERLFKKSPKGFWPSEMAFSMEMIPALDEAGYEYVVVDHVHVKPLKDREKPDCFKPYRITYEKNEIAVIPRNRDISNAQESGMNPSWFIDEVTRKLKEYSSQEKARLVTTWSDGENGGWFRQMDENSGFFGYFFAPLMEKIKEKKAGITPVKISEFIKKYPPRDHARVQTGAWNVASTSGYDFSQWNGSESQKRAIEKLFSVRRRHHDVEKKKGLTASQKKKIDEAKELILDAETSCYLFWGDAWIPKLYEKLDEASRLLSL